jgi:hypothetical protein
VSSNGHETPVSTASAGQCRGWGTPHTASHVEGIAFENPVARTIAGTVTWARAALMGAKSAASAATSGCVAFHANAQHPVARWRPLEAAHVPCTWTI